MPLPAAVAQLIRGFTMGSADIVPGVSGGTVALVLGIYDRLIANVRRGAHGLRQLLTADVRGAVRTVREIEWVWLLSLLAGILLAIVLLASLLERLLDEQPIEMAALFLGLVVGTVWIAWRMLTRVDAIAVALIVGVGLAMFLLLGLRSDTTVADGAAEVVTEPLWVFFGAGAIAICAMILPGISGSFLLVLLGMYTEVLGAVNDRDLLTLAVFTAGCIVGLALFSTLLNWLLQEHHERVLAAMIGLMVGSTRALWPWPGGTQTTTLAAPRGTVLVPVLLAVAGCAAVVAVELVGRRRAGARSVDQPTSAASRSIPSTRSASPRANENLP